MLSRNIIKFFCSKTTSRSMELLRKVQVSHQSSLDLTEKLKSIEEEVKEKEKQVATRNKQINQLRQQLTNDIKKGDQLRSSGQKKAKDHRIAAIQDFAKGLVKLGPSLETAQSYKDQGSSEDFTSIQQGYELTLRLFYSTLNKYNIKKMEFESGTKFNKETMDAVEDIETQQKEKKGKVFEMRQNGWQTQGKVIQKAKVAVYK